MGSRQIIFSSLLMIAIGIYMKSRTGSLGITLSDVKEFVGFVFLFSGMLFASWRMYRFGIFALVAIFYFAMPFVWRMDLLPFMSYMLVALPLGTFILAHFMLRTLYRGNRVWLHSALNFILIGFVMLIWVSPELISAGKVSVQMFGMVAELNAHLFEVVVVASFAITAPILIRTYGMLGVVLHGVACALSYSMHVGVI